ncbi:5'-methylthioadenosine phosphorylase [Pseudohyphozyma bogoriensis]|nr:5'-methylthioadenosine phosphorylase [Pseudohyphozyma bogoriensis]
MGYPKLMENPPLVGVIGGSGLYKLDNLHVLKTLDVHTPWGAPSSPITIASLDTPKGPVTVAFIARHGLAHHIPPSSVPARANIAALKHLGVKAVVAFSAVGSLREEIRPGDVIVPDQIIDRTKGVRPSSFFDGNCVAHAMFGDPFDVQLTDFIVPHVKAAIDSFCADSGVKGEATPRLHSNKTVVVMEGPQFSTRAESNMYRQWGGDIINMSSIPESKLAREAELSYALVCTSTDYDAWRVGEHPVTVEEVMKTLSANSSLSKHVTKEILGAVHEAVKNNSFTRAEGGMRYSLVNLASGTARGAAVTPREQWKLKYLLPQYFEHIKEDPDKIIMANTSTLLPEDRITQELAEYKKLPTTRAVSSAECVEGLHRLKGKVVVLTGAGSGFGKEYALRAGRAGAKLVLSDINLAGVKAVADEVVAAGGLAIAARCDTTSWEEQHAMFDLAISTYEHVDIVVPNAGLPETGEWLHDTMDADGKLAKPNLKTLEVNITGVCYTVKLAMYHLARNPSTERKAVVLLGSLSSYFGLPGASKHAMLGLYRSGYYSGEPYNINFTIVCPWFVLTPILGNTARVLIAGLPLSTVPDVVDAMLLGSTSEAKGDALAVDPEGVIAIPFDTMGNSYYGVFISRTQRALRFAKTAKDIYLTFDRDAEWIRTIVIMLSATFVAFVAAFIWVFRP